MKIRYMLFLICMLFIGGCKDSLGSFHKGTINYQKLIWEINQMSHDGVWEMELLQDESIDDTMLAQQFFIRSDQITSYAVFIPVVSMSPCEIAILQGDATMIEQAMSQHIEKRKQEEIMLSGYQELLEQALLFQIRDYYILIIGKDASKIKSYMESLK